MHKLPLSVLALLLVSISTHAAEPLVVRWDKGKSGEVVAALDLTARAVKWELQPCRSVNFIKTTASGVLVGCDDSHLLMLDPVNGSERWRRNFVQDQPIGISGAHKPQKRYDVDKYRGEAPGGYIVSDSEAVYFYVSVKGEYLLRCDQPCADALMSTKLHAGKFLVMRWDYGKPKGQGIAAFDVAAQKIAWEWNDCRTPNFVEPTSLGFIVGCDDATVAMLNGESGAEIWRTSLASQKSETSKREIQIERYHGERPEGFVVSHSNDIFMLVGKKGEPLMRCEQQCVSR